MEIKKNKGILLLGMLMICLLVPTVCFASGGSAGLPWEGPLESIKNSLTGPVATGVTTIIVIVTGIMIGAGEGGAAGRKLLQLVCGLAMALAAAGWINNIFGSGALLG